MTWKVGIITVSDRCSRGEQEDVSGRRLRELCRNWEVIAYEIIPDEQPLIEDTLIRFADELGCQLILTTGGTGFAPRDVTPEATKAVIHKEVPGLGETMRRETVKYTNLAIVSRATAGIRNQSLIINFPGNPKGVQQCFEAISDVIPHGLRILTDSPLH
ncbi:molybdopterin adenylyltransferase [Laceyella putida]|uniref:Molybdopterin adenylyltransferase n=1 Tax=Laceyella putida TaxID=110101 RepID=A0ABW2RMM9_9BACL